MSTVTLTQQRRFDAVPEVVFDAWTEPEMLRRWWKAGPDWETPLAEVDLRVGGAYRLAMRNPETGDEHVVGGQYREVERPHRLVYTWAWEGEGPPGNDESLVTVLFRDEGGATTVVLTHTGFVSEEQRAMHEHGWTATLDQLESVMQEVAAAR